MYIYIYIYIYKLYIYMYVEKVKWKKNMFDGLFICQHILTSIFFECKNVLKFF